MPHHSGGGRCPGMLQIGENYPLFLCGHYHLGYDYPLGGKSLSGQTSHMESAMLHLKKVDPIMAKIIKRVGPCQFALREPTFETLARSIAFQQLSGKAAATIFGRVRKAAGRRFTARAFLRLTP